MGVAVKSRCRRDLSFPRPVEQDALWLLGRAWSLPHGHAIFRAGRFLEPWI